MADEDISLTEDQLLENLDGNNGDAEFEDESIHIDPELEAIKARVKEMEEWQSKLKQIDDRSIYVENVDYGATTEELEAHFHGYGSMKRVTILCDKADGLPKRFAYIEFGSKDFAEKALAMNDTLFRGRQIKVMAKLTNQPGISTTSILRSHSSGNFSEENSSTDGPGLQPTKPNIETPKRKSYTKTFISPSTKAARELIDCVNELDFLRIELRLKPFEKYSVTELKKNLNFLRTILDCINIAVEMIGITRNRIAYEKVKIEEFNIQLGINENGQEEPEEQLAFDMFSPKKANLSTEAKCSKVINAIWATLELVCKYGRARKDREKSKKIIHKLVRLDDALDNQLNTLNYEKKKIEPDIKEYDLQINKAVFFDSSQTEYNQ